MKRLASRDRQKGWSQMPLSTHSSYGICSNQTCQTESQTSSCGQPHRRLRVDVGDNGRPPWSLASHFLGPCFSGSRTTEQELSYLGVGGPSTSREAAPVPTGLTQAST